MEPFTLDRSFHKKDIIDGFSSIIWTERYYGDGEVELVTPPTKDMINKLQEGTFLGVNGSEEVMIVENVSIEPDKLKVTGISMLPWMNNRFIRTTALHQDRYWYLEGSPGWVLWAIIYYMCVGTSPYLDGTVDTGIDNPQQFAIPGLVLGNYDDSLLSVKLGIPFGPVYDAMKEIASTYQIGMSLTLGEVTDTSYLLFFRSYRGLTRTTDQTVNPVVRFSPLMDSFTNIKELHSIEKLKTLVYAFAPENPDGLATEPGVSALSGPQYTGFDLRAMLVFAEDITTDMVGGSTANLVSILNSRARDALNANHYVIAVDGEIVPESQFKYGVHYNLGDVIEVQGNSGVVQTARITEFIRAQDQRGERAYPTVTMIE